MKNILPHRALTPQEVQQIAGKQIRVVRYTDLKNYKSIEDLFGRIKCVLILYQKTNNSGHWACLINQPKKVVFYDSYALEPDDQLQFTGIKTRKDLGIDLPYITYLLYYSKKPIDYNDEQMQVFNDNIETCGYWCGARMRYSNLTSDGFINMIKHIPLKERDNAIIRFSNQYLK